LEQELARVVGERARVLQSLGYARMGHRGEQKLDGLRGTEDWLDGVEVGEGEGVVVVRGFADKDRDDFVSEVGD